MALRHPGDIAASLNAPMSYRDARRFWLINVGLLCLPLMVLCYLVPIDVGVDEGTLRSIVVRSFAVTPGTWYGANAVLPWMSGAVRPWAAALSTGLSILLITGTPSYLFQLMPVEAYRRDRAAALSLYSSGSLVAGPVFWTVLAAGVAVFWFAARAVVGDTAIDYGFVLAATFGFVPSLSILTWWLLIWQVYRRMSQAGFLRMAAVAVLIPLITLLGVVLAWGILPWCIGLIRIMLLSLQP